MHVSPTNYWDDELIISPLEADQEDPDRDSQDEAQEEDGSLAPIIIAVVIISLIAAGALLLILHFKKLLPQGFYK